MMKRKFGFLEVAISSGCVRLLTTGTGAGEKAGAKHEAVQNVERRAGAGSKQRILCDHGVETSRLVINAIRLRLEHVASCSAGW